MPIYRDGSVELASRCAELNKDFQGHPDPFAEQLDAAPENPKAAEAREELTLWRSFIKQPWVPPETLTTTAIDMLEEQPTVWLDAAINLMAFGSTAPTLPVVLNLENGARRQQALVAICNSKKFSFVRDGIFVNVPDDIPQSLWPETKIRETSDFIDWLRRSLSRAGGGRPPEFNWEGARAHCLSLIDRYGKPGPHNQKLPRQSDVIELVAEYFAAMDIHPARPTIKKKVARWLKGT